MQRIALHSSSEEFQKVWNLFTCTMPNHCIQKIERVQNVALWEVYQWCVRGAPLVVWASVPTDGGLLSMPWAAGKSETAVTASPVLLGAGAVPLLPVPSPTWLSAGLILQRVGACGPLVTEPALCSLLP